MVTPSHTHTPKQTPHFDTRSEIYQSRYTNLALSDSLKLLIKRLKLKVHKTSEIVRENICHCLSVSRARWVISALMSLLSDLSLA